jgi:hypothetical protein
MLLRDGRMGMVDWGIVGRLDDATRHLFRRFVEAVLGDQTAWPEIIAFMREHGPLGGGDGGDGDDGRDGAPSTATIPAEAREEIEGILTRPFGEVSLVGAFSGPDRRLGEEARPLTRGERRERRGRIRELRQRMIGSGFADTQLAQANFMLFKQLLYFERYGKMYMADTALMGDADWLRHVLATST